jgi:C1A family cysteine protease
LIKIDNHNDLFKEGLVEFTMAPNKFTHWSAVQFRKIRPQLNIESLPGGRSKRALPQNWATVPTCTNLPTNKSWVDEGKVQAIKDQGSCGSCYIFASLTVIESAVAISYKTSPPSYSEQQNLDCISNGCNGGWYTHVWPLTQINGGVVQTASYYSYQDRVYATCNNNYVKDTRAIMDYYDVFPEKNEASAPCYVYNNGPVWSAIYAADDFQFVGKGIYVNYDGQCVANPSSVNHAVVVVGYGTTSSGIPYWLIRNSWGTSWGIFLTTLKK